MHRSKIYLAIFLCLLLAMPAQAAWSVLNNLGLNNDKTSTHTSFTITTTAAAEVNNVIVVCAAWDNTETTDVEATHISVSDSAGNSYSLAKDFNNGQGAAAAGANATIFYSKVTTQLNNGATITITSDTARIASGAQAQEFGIASGNVVSVEGGATAADDGVDPSSMAISSLASGEYLWFHCLAGEGPGTDTYTASSNYAACNTGSGGGTSGGGAASNMQAYCEHRIFTGTSDSVDFASTTADRDYAQTYVALKEAAAAATTCQKTLLLTGAGC